MVCYRFLGAPTMTEKWEEFGALLSEARTRNSLTQRDLAKYVDRDATTVSRWEKGERRPNQNSLLALSRVLGIRIQTLQSMAGNTPEFDWYASFSAKPGSQDDILLSASEEEKESLRQYLHYLRFHEQVRQSIHSTP